jgi:curved DNA-binding protein CbpA
MKEMGLRRCLEILDLGREASIEDVNQAYRDCVNVWHPDRFANNPRLREKAEKKLKEINEAHDTLTSFLSAGHKAALSKSAKAQPERETSSDDRERKTPAGERGAFEPSTGTTGSRTEALAETGTWLFLTASSRIRRMFRRWIDADGS